MYYVATTCGRHGQHSCLLQHGFNSNLSVGGTPTLHRMWSNSCVGKVPTLHKHLQTVVHLFVNFLIIHGIRHPKLHFTRFTEHCFSIDFLPLTYNGKDKWFFSRSPGKYIFHLHLFPLPITAFQKGPFGQNRGVLEDIFFENHFTCKYVYGDERCCLSRQELFLAVPYPLLKK